MAIKKTDSGKLILANADYLFITPYTDEDTIGTQTYDVVNIVADSLSFTPDDNSINSKEWEFGDTPLFETVTLGKIQFAANCIDFQNEVMKAIMGWTASSDGSVVYAPNAYKEIYAVVEVGFKNEDVVVVAPKLKLNSKAIISTMKTGTSEGNLAGTAYNANLSTDKDTAGAETPMAIIQTGADKNTKFTITTGAGAAEFTIGGATDPKWTSAKA